MLQTWFFKHCYADNNLVYIAVLPKETLLDILTKLEAKIEPGKDGVDYFFNSNRKTRVKRKYSASDRIDCIAKAIFNFGIYFEYGEAGKFNVQS